VSGTSSHRERTGSRSLAIIALLALALGLVVAGCAEENLVQLDKQAARTSA
jgi:hypothetical protein